MEIRYRQARAEDAPAIAALMSQAAGGILEFVLEGIVPGHDPLQLMALPVASESSKFSYRNCLVAERDGQVVAETNFYPARGRRRFFERLPQTLSPVAFLKLLWRLWRFRGMERQIPEQSFYINSLAVEPEQRWHGIGSELLRRIEHVARESGLSQLSLHVWADNDSALYDWLESKSAGVK